MLDRYSKYFYMNKNILPLNEDLVENIFKLSRLMKLNMSFNKDLTHLTMLQLQALIYLKKNQEATISDVANQFKIELPSATSLINNLCKTKILKKKHDPKDKRCIAIGFTNRGSLLFKKAMEERTQKTKKILSFLSDKEKNTLLIIVKKLIGKAGEI